MAKIFLNKKITPRIANGHPWIFANEIGEEVGEYAPGSIVDVFSSNGSLVGQGYINPKSQIKIRLLARNQVVIDYNFFYNKIILAWQYRQKINLIQNCRIVNGESDGLPGLIIDKYNNYFVVQFITLGIIQWKAEIVKAILSIWPNCNIYERSDMNARSLEGLNLEKGFITEEFETNFTIQENGIQQIVDIANGQRTGYFLEQKFNRNLISNIAKDALVLDAFCYTGSFGILAAKHGAQSVLGWDISEKAIFTATQNSALNNCEKQCVFETLNAFDALKQLSKTDKKFDVVILDPPTFANNKSNIDKALASYKEINLRAMKLLNAGGFLVSCSNTNLVDASLFQKTINEAAKDANKSIRQVFSTTQSPDFTYEWHIPSSNFLKFYILQVN